MDKRKLFFGVPQSSEPIDVGIISKANIPITKNLFFLILSFSIKVLFRT